MVASGRKRNGCATFEAGERKAAAAPGERLENPLDGFQRVLAGATSAQPSALSLLTRPSAAAAAAGAAAPSPVPVAPIAQHHGEPTTTIATIVPKRRATSFRGPLGANSMVALLVCQRWRLRQCGIV